MLRIDVYYGGITGCWKLINVCQAFGLQCEIHGPGWAHAQLLGAAPARILTPALEGTWEWDGIVWVQTGASAPARTRHAMTFDAALR